MVIGIIVENLKIDHIDRNVFIGRDLPDDLVGHIHRAVQSVLFIRVILIVFDLFENRFQRLDRFIAEMHADPRIDRKIFRQLVRDIDALVLEQSDPVDFDRR
ncbi:hypothetical protein SDC9_198197 [bioreactor metagenome]|uniref:Uncharacterized protein n=1 Tax=bioreactor metagenome TaxID=1076179 RepID=A0A645IHI0_9ZZZZ